MNASKTRVSTDFGPADITTKTPWPKAWPEQFAVARTALQDLGEATPDQIARRVQRLRKSTVQPLLESLILLGQACIIEGGRRAV